jgi:hypothetical protein
MVARVGVGRTNVGKNVEELETLYTVAENVKWYSHCGKHMAVLQNIKDSPLLSIAPKEHRTRFLRDTCTVNSNTLH